MSLIESSILSEVDDTSILRTGLPSPLWPSSQLASGLSSLAPRSGLERSDFVPWHPSDVLLGNVSVGYPAVGGRAYMGANRRDCSWVEVRHCALAV